MIHPTTGGVFIDVRVIPRAGKSDLAGTRDGALLVRLNAPPVEDAANKKLIELLARELGVAKRAVTIVSGERSRQKRVRVHGSSVAIAKVRLELTEQAEGPVKHGATEKLLPPYPPVRRPLLVRT